MTYSERIVTYYEYSGVLGEHLRDMPEILIECFKACCTVVLLLLECYAVDRMSRLKDWIWNVLL